MTKTNKVFYWLLLLSSISGFLISYLPGLPGQPIQIWWQEFISLVSYFTIISNLAIALLAISQLFFPQSILGLKLSSMTAQTSIAVYITITGVIYHLLLANTWEPQGIEKISDALLHTATPILYVLFWWTCARGKPLNISRTFPMLLVPVLYMIYWLIRGPIVGSYPYFFIDAAELGYASVLANGLGLCVAFWVVGAFYWSLSKFTTPLYV